MPINKGFVGSSSHRDVTKTDDGTGIQMGIILKVKDIENKKNVNSMKSNKNNDTGRRKSRKKTYR